MSTNQHRAIKIKRQRITLETVELKEVVKEKQQDWEKITLTIEISSSVQSPKVVSQNVLHSSSSGVVS